MKRWIVVAIGGAMALGLGRSLQAAQEEMEPLSSETTLAVPTTTELSDEQVHQAISKYVDEVTQNEGAFLLDDEMTGETRELTLLNIHDDVHQAGEYAYACVEMKDAKSGETLDVDFDVESFEGEVEVVDIAIHKVNGQERFRYDDQHNRVPVSG